MKIVVYAICKNEAQFVSRWIKSMSEADQIVVLDTGSTDDTVQRLRALGAQVTVETICPWRFDVARNRSLELVDPDADICVCTDLDEVFHPGWRKALESAWIPGTTQGHLTATPGAFARMVAKVWSSGMKRSMPVTATVGSIRYMRSWSGWGLDSRA